MACKDKKHHTVEIFAKTIFGHGDSSTEVWGQCPDCGKKTNIKNQMGFPATEAIMRMVQQELENK